jgi:hypothetical protein
MPVINVNFGLKRGWGINTKFESRQILLTAVDGEENEYNLNYVLTDLSLLASKKVGLNNSLVAGYRARFIDGLVLHEFRQQFTLIRSYSGFRMAYRFMATQMFGSDITPEYRLRFRLTAMIALNGQTVDPKEFYLKISNEYITSIQSDIFNYELRLVPLIGYEFNDNNKLEFGLDYRLSSLFEESLVNTFWINVGWYIRPFRSGTL